VMPPRYFLDAKGTVTARDSAIYRADSLDWIQDVRLTRSENRYWWLLGIVVFSVSNGILR